MEKSKRNIILLIPTLLFVILVIGIVIYLISSGNYKVFYSKPEFKAFIGGFGYKAPFIFFLFQSLQVLFLTVPGSITTIAGGAMFGFWSGFLLSYIGISLGSLLTFVVCRKLGQGFVRKIIGDKNFNKYFSVLTARKLIMIFLMLLLPFFPDNIICAISGLSSIKFRHFIVIVFVTRPWGLAFSSLVGAGLLQAPMKLIIIFIPIVVVIALLGIKFFPKIEDKLVVLLKMEK